MHRIREILAEKQMRQAELARRLETSPAQVSRKMAGERSMTLADLFDFAHALRTPPFKLIAGSEAAAILTESEQALLDTYRTLDAEHRERLLAQAIGYLRAQRGEITEAEIAPNLSLPEPTLSQGSRNSARTQSTKTASREDAE